MIFDWKIIEAKLNTMRFIDGGISLAKKGIITSNNGQHIFVKIGTNDDTKGWANKEIALYRYLNEVSFTYIPQLIAVNSDETGFATTAYIPEEGWDWQDNWNKLRIDNMLKAKDELAAIELKSDLQLITSEHTISEKNDGWNPLADSPELMSALITKLQASKRGDIADSINIAKEVELSSQFNFRNDKFVHNDIRADNCPWSQTLGEVRMVDWNWAQMGDRRIDDAGTLVAIHKSGFDVTKNYLHRLDRDALHWVTGFWFKGAATPIWPGGPAHLRDVQLQSGIIAWDLSKRLQ